MASKQTASRELEEETPLTEAELEHFKQTLTTKRVNLIQAADENREQELQLDTNEMPDEVDLASTEYAQAFALRLRGRERFFLDKINEALRKIDEGIFGECEECGEPIGRKRLEARPETTLCINCKEEQERQEREYK
jgi:DnaK suppressor protein